MTYRGSSRYWLEGRVATAACVACLTLAACSSSSDQPGHAGVLRGRASGGSAGTFPATAGTSANGGAAGEAAGGGGGGAGGEDQGQAGAAGSSAGAAATGIPPRWGSSCAAPTGAGVEHTSNVTADETWLAADSPHIVSSNLVVSAKLTIESCAVVEVAAGRTLSVVGSGRLATLVAEPSAMLRFHAVSALAVDPSGAGNPAAGALVAEGTATDPVLFTSAEVTPAPADWLGIVLGGVVDSSTVIDQARVEYAGGSSNVPSSSCPLPGIYGRYNDAAIRIVGGKPAREFVTNTAISDSGSNGIDRGYLAPCPDGGSPGPDFLPSNTFQNIAWCQQTYPGPVSGSCPDPVPCPH
jgi:hypothetical protein